MLILNKEFEYRRGPDQDGVAGTIREIIESETWRLRHPAGASARPFLDGRAAMTDEAWVEFGALEDDAWSDRVQS